MSTIQNFSLTEGSELLARNFKLRSGIEADEVVEPGPSNPALDDNLSNLCSWLNQCIKQNSVSGIAVSTNDRVNSWAENTLYYVLLRSQKAFANTQIGKDQLREALDEEVAEYGPADEATNQLSVIKDILAVLSFAMVMEDSDEVDPVVRDRALSYTANALISQDTGLVEELTRSPFLYRQLIEHQFYTAIDTGEIDGHELRITTLDNASEAYGTFLVDTNISQYKLLVKPMEQELGSFQSSASCDFRRLYSLLRASAHLPDDYLSSEPNSSKLQELAPSILANDKLMAHEDYGVALAKVASQLLIALGAEGFTDQISGFLDRSINEMSEPQFNRALGIVDALSAYRNKKIENLYEPMQSACSYLTSDTEPYEQATVQEKVWFRALNDRTTIKHLVLNNQQQVGVRDQALNILTSDKEDKDLLRIVRQLYVLYDSDQIADPARQDINKCLDVTLKNLEGLIAAKIVYDNSRFGAHHAKPV